LSILPVYDVTHRVTPGLQLTDIKEKKNAKKKTKKQKKKPLI